jgi:ABC-type bacteriocin/lantibiotic exporter with double-glycine peptidase domain
MTKVSVRSSLNKFFLLLKTHNKDLINIYITSIFIGFISLTLPVGMQMVINLITTGFYTSSWYLMIGLVIFGLIISSSLYIYLMFVMERLQQKIFLFTTFDIATLIPEWKIDLLHNKNNFEFLNRFFDVINIQKDISKIIIDFISNFFLIFFGLLLLSFYHTFFLGISLVLIILVFLLLRFTSNKGLENSIMESKYKYKTVYWIQELANSIQTFKQFADKEFNIQKTDELSNKYLEYRKKHFSVLVAQYAWMSLFKILFISSFLIVGGVLVIEQQMNIGQFVAAEIIIIMLFNSMEKLILTFEKFYDIFTAIEKVSELYDTQIEKNGEEILPISNDLGLTIQLNNINYTFLNSTYNVLKNINLQAKSGEKIAIISKSEQIKLAILNVIAGYYDEFSGEYLVNNIPIRHLENTSFRKYVGDLFSRTNIFYGTLKENLILNNAKITTEELFTYIKKFHLERLVNRLSEGLNTELNSNDERIAISNQLKIKFIRTMIAQPKMIVTYNFWQNFNDEEEKTFKDYIFNNPNLTVICAINSNEDLSLFDKVYEF